MGNVRRERGGKGLCKSGRVLKLFLHPTGYLQVCLNNKCKKLVRVHRIVAEAFFGKCHDGKEVNHLNGNKHDNCAENLEFCTKSENVVHTFRTLKRVPISKEQHGRAKLTNIQVHEIIQEVATGKTQQAVADRFGVTQTCISKVVTGLRWRR
jgi:uncharacterized protein (DUF433 family)